MREGDTSARLGGDEFAAVMEGLRDAEGARIAGERLLQALAAPYVIGGKEVQVTASIGVSVYPTDAGNHDGFKRAANLAMYLAKDDGGNRCQSYSPALENDFVRAAARHDDTRRDLASLTRRERQVLHILTEGKASKMIAFLLGTSPRTIDAHRASIMSKMHTRSVQELVRRVLDARGMVLRHAPSDANGNQKAA